VTTPIFHIRTKVCHDAEKPVNQAQHRDTQALTGARRCVPEKPSIKKNREALSDELEAKCKLIKLLAERVDVTQ